MKFVELFWAGVSVWVRISQLAHWSHVGLEGPTEVPASLDRLAYLCVYIYIYIYIYIYVHLFIHS